MPPPRPRPHRRTPPRLTRLPVIVATLVLGIAAAHAAPPYSGRGLEEVLREFATQGLQLIYNAELVRPDLKVTREPAPGPALVVLDELLAQHGLRTRRIADGVYAIVRAEEPKGAAPVAPSDAAPALESVTVTASRYSLASDIPDVHTFLTQAELDSLPRIADDALKAVHRLPGAASNGLSGLAHMRGGEENETLVIFDGLPMYEPFHLRLLQSPTSVLDERVVDGLDVYAGGFTAEYGDRMSAIIDAHSLHPEGDHLYELGVSVFHTSALASQRFADGRGQWLVALRRSNLDLVADVLHSDLGDAKYSDGFARIDYAFSPETRGSLHVLLANDKATRLNSNDTETVNARYGNSYVWATLEHDWSPRLHGRALLSYTNVTSEREGVVDDPGNRTGSVDDQRDYDVLGLKLDASYGGERWLHRAGVEMRSMSAVYDYKSAITFAAGYPFPDSPPYSQSRYLAPKPTGRHYAAYVTSRIRLTDTLTAEAGLRWDDQSYSPDTDNQLGPRLNLAWSVTPATRLRASWGRFQQFQGIEELQVEDGVADFHRSQRADHSILGLEHDFPAGFGLRLETYQKDYSELRPRYENLFDPLSLVPELRWDRVKIAPQSARAQGTELLLTRRSSDPWNGWFSYAWSRVTDHVSGMNELRSWDQTNTVNAGLTWSDGGWQVTLAGTYHTGWPVTPVGLAPDGRQVVLGPRNSSRYADFASVDLRASRDVAVRVGSLNVFAELTNALDRRNPCCVDYSIEPAPDGATVIDREYRHWLPIVPSFGVLWKF